MSRYDFAFDWDGPYGHAVRLVADHAPAGGLVLDLGCGAAAIAEPLAAAGFGYHGVDVDTETVERLRARGLPASVVDLTSDKAALELRDIVAGSTVAAVSALDVVEHLPEPEPFLASLAELLADLDGAVFVASIPNVAHVDLAAKLVAGRWDVTPTGLLDSTHISLFNEERVRMATAAAGLTELARSDFVLPVSDQHFPPDHPILAAGVPVADLLSSVRRSVDPFAEVNQFIRLYTPDRRRSVRRADDAGDGDTADSITPPATPFVTVAVVLTRNDATLVDTLACLSGQTDDDIDIVLLADAEDRRDLADVADLVADHHPEFASRVQLVHIPGAARAELLTTALDTARGRYLCVLDEGDLVTGDWIAAFREAAPAAPASVLRSVAVDQGVRPAPDASVSSDVFTLTGFEANRSSRFDLIEHLQVNGSPPGAVALPVSSLRALGLGFSPEAEDADWELVVRAAQLIGVHDTDHRTVVRRRWDDIPASGDIERWKAARANLHGRLDSAPLLLPTGAASTLAGPEPVWDWRRQIQRIHQLEAQLGALRTAALVAERALSEADETAARLRSELADQAELSAHELAAATERHSHLLTEHVTVMEQRRRLVEELDGARRETEQFRHALQQHQESRWWKLTAPARWAWLRIGRRRSGAGSDDDG